MATEIKLSSSSLRYIPEAISFIFIQRTETLSFGADTYVQTNEASQISAIKNSLDLLIVTINASVDWNPYIACMRQNGVIVFVGAIRDKPLPLNIFGPFIAKQVSRIHLFYIVYTD